MKKRVLTIKAAFVALLLCLLLPVVAVLPINGFAATETEMMAQAPEVPPRFADATVYASGSFEDYVDTDAFVAYLKEQIQNCATEIDISAYGIPRVAGYMSELGSYIVHNLPDMFHFDRIGPYYHKNGIITRITVIYHDFADTKAEYEACAEEFDAVAEQMLEGIQGNTGLTDVEKALLLHDRLVVWTEYDYANYLADQIPDISYTAYGILVKQTGVCQGYALTYDYLLEQVGIRCEYVSSDLLNHAWNIVYINNTPYHVDATWDDPVWDMTGRVKHTNFLRSTSGIVETGHHKGGYIDYTSAPADTTYDRYYWQNSTTAFQLVDGRIYYIDNTTQTLNYLDGNSRIELFSVEGKWPYGENMAWGLNCSKLSSVNTMLLYSLPDGVYRYDPSSGATSKAYNPDLSFGSYFAVYGFKYEDGNLICDLSNTPSFDGNTKKNYQVVQPYCVQHSFTNYVSDGNATYLEDGTKTAICDREGCGVTDTVTDEGSRLLANGWLLEGDKWAYYKNGVKQTGWLKLGGTYYYMDKTGVMVTGWLQEGKTWYYLDASGAMVTGWKLVGSNWYYFQASGAMVTGWLQQGNIWYYLKASGAMATGWCKIGSVYYYFDGNGCMKTGWLQQGSTWYYLKASGAMATSWEQIGGNWYYFNASGAMVTGWQKVGNDWYFFRSGGAMVTGWMKQGNIWYYFDKNGVMATGRVKIDNVWYNFAQSGAWIP